MKIDILRPRQRTFARHIKATNGGTQWYSDNMMQTLIYLGTSWYFNTRAISEKMAKKRDIGANRSHEQKYD